MRSNTLNKEKCSGRHPGCIADFKKELPVLCVRFSIRGGKNDKKFKPVIKNGKCLSYLPNEKLIKALEYGKS
jgi:hypothetical protein